MARSIFEMSMHKIYQLYQQKLLRKERSLNDLDTIITWLTGYQVDAIKALQQSEEVTVRAFFENAPQMNANANKITGVICGVRVETIEDPLMQQVRWLDKLVDELYRGKALTKILRD